MKIETINELLIDVIGKASKITSKNPNQPILENILFEVIDESTLRITSYNLDIFYTQDVFIKTKEKGKYSKICINPNLLLSYLNLFGKNENVFIEISEKTIKIKINNQESDIQTVSSDGYPDIKNFNISNNNDSLTINSDLFIDGVQSVSFAAALSSIKPELSCVLISYEDDIFNFVATDGFRLVEKKKIVNKDEIKNIDDFKQILITAKNLNDLLKIIYSNISISIFLEKGLFCVKTSDSLLCVRTVSGLYPNYKAIIPTNFVTNIEMNTSDIVDALKVSNIFSDDFNYVKIDITDNDINFYSKNSKIGESFSKKDILKTGESIVQNYNHRYLSDFLSKVKSDKIIIEISGKTTPTVIKPKDDNGYIYMVMPMNK
jgi:DNA polymerase III subunit beta